MPVHTRGVRALHVGYVCRCCGMRVTEANIDTCLHDALGFASDEERQNGMALSVEPHAWRPGAHILAAATMQRQTTRV